MAGILEILTTGDNPVSLDEAKRHLRVLHNDDDESIQTLLDGVVSQVQERTGRAIRPTTAKYILPEFPCGDDEQPLPLPPFNELTSVKYYDLSNNLQTLASCVPLLPAVPGVVLPPSGTNWPDTYERPDAVTFEFASGFNATTLPKTLKIGIFFGLDLAYSDLPWLESKRLEERFDACVRSWVLRDQRTKAR